MYFKFSHKKVSIRLFAMFVSKLNWKIYTLLTSYVAFSLLIFINITIFIIHKRLYLISKTKLFISERFEILILTIFSWVTSFSYFSEKFY